jgi:hypothetical protein
VLADCARGDWDGIVYNNFSDKSGQYHEVTTVSGFFSRTTISEALFISGTVWRTDYIQARIGTFVDFCYTLSPHVCVLLSGVEKAEARLLIADRKLVDGGKSGGISWSSLEYMRRSPLLLQCLNSRENQRVAARAQWVNFIWALQYTFDRCRTLEEIERWRAALKAALADYAEHLPTAKFKYDCWRATAKHLLLRLLRGFRRSNRKRDHDWRSSVFLPSSLLAANFPRSSDGPPAA